MESSTDPLADISVQGDRVPRQNAFFHSLPRKNYSVLARSLFGACVEKGMGVSDQRLSAMRGPGRRLRGISGFGDRTASGRSPAWAESAIAASADRRCDVVAALRAPDLGQSFSLGRTTTQRNLERSVCGSFSWWYVAAGHSSGERPRSPSPMLVAPPSSTEEEGACHESPC